MAKKKIEELNPEDFTSLELTAESLNEWKQVYASMRKNQIILAIVVLGIFGIIFLITGEVFLPGLLVILVIQYLIQSKFNKLSKQLGITNKLIRKAQSQ